MNRLRFNPSSPWVGIALGTIVVVALAYQVSVMREAAHHIRDLRGLISAPKPQVVINRESSMISFHTEWDSGTDHIVVHTVCGVDYNGNPIQNETPEECAERHRETVARLKVLFPPNP